MSKSEMSGSDLSISPDDDHHLAFHWEDFSNKSDIHDVNDDSDDSDFDDDEDYKIEEESFDDLCPSLLNPPGALGDVKQVGLKKIPIVNGKLSSVPDDHAHSATARSDPEIVDNDFVTRVSSTALKFL
ncbi:OLC1v1008868C1 [Oldenlandia corymbosa var. corymbosa]|uniref:OLC1v1008868C1 n=1 Tax=Oldenlandia corymbosa var. corymbosa TaxID=529605 RepID=A0AAV1DQS4_OLDCO|nr:OLC1v1008868C1 [Oldenlandia corymbosa var. corymbosa]